jgi:hypothetical protein
VDGIGETMSNEEVTIMEWMAGCRRFLACARITDEHWNELTRALLKALENGELSDSLDEAISKEVYYLKRNFFGD